MLLGNDQEPTERGSSVVVVALPSADDPVWVASSEKVPHMTILYFGKNVAAGDIGWLKGVVKEAAAKMQPFHATVTSREPLGDDGADVVMLDIPKQMLDARAQMLEDHTTKTMFDAVEQYPSWTPHTTLGYPESPARGDLELGSTIKFDRLAVWDGDYEGEEYPMTTSRWAPYAEDTRAVVAAPMPPEVCQRHDVRVLLPLAESDSRSLVLGGVVGADLSIPLMSLGTVEALSSEMRERISTVLQSVAESRSQTLAADLGAEYGVTDNILWTKPHIEGLNALRARLISAFAQNDISFDRAFPEHVVNFASTAHGDAALELLADRTPHRATLDRLALQAGDDVFEFPFSTSSTTAVLASALDPGLVVDGDSVGVFAELDPNATPATGAPFRIPMLVPEGVPTGDGRIFRPLALRTRDLPLPLLWQIKTSDGHDGSVVVGRIDSIERLDNGLGNAHGVFDTGPYGREAERMVRGKFLRGVSADLDQFEAVAEDQALSDDAPETGKRLSTPTITVSGARVIAATVVAKPAFQECTIELVEPQQEEPLVADGIYVDTPTLSDAEALTACAMVASHIPTAPPAKWFDNPSLHGPTPLTVDDAGRVFGHIAAWHVDHIGLPFGTRPPRSRSNYAYFHTGVCRAAEGNDISVGQLTLAGGHAALDLSAHAAVKHYDDTASAVADVHAGEDAYGIWVAGALRPGTTPEQIRVLRASAPSGDWRPVNGRLELVAVCQVNVPGFPVARARVASGYVTALVAAGASALAEMRGPTVEDRIAMLERGATQDRVKDDAAMAVRRFRAAQLAADYTEFRMYSKETLEDYAKRGWAVRSADGKISYPIRDVGDLRRAVRAYGRARKEDKPKIRKHIMKRARGLDRPDLIPEQWMKAATVGAKVELSKQSPDYDFVTDVLAITAALSYAYARPKDFEEKHHPRDDRGKFRKVLFRLKGDLEDLPETDTTAAQQQVDAAIAAEEAHDTDAAKEAADRLLVELDKISGNVGDLDDKADLRSNGAILGEVLARLPLAQGDPDVKMRYTDLPMELRGLVDDLLARLKSAVEPAVYEEVAGPMARYISGADYMASDEIQSHLSRIMRYLI